MQLTRNTENGLLNLILFGALALRLHELTRQDIWWDEARNIDVALRPFFEVATSPELDIHPPVYFWLLHLWSRVAGITMSMEPVQIAYLARFLSVACGVAGVALLFALTKKLAGRQVALLAGLIGAFSPFWLAESQEARMYTLGFALLTAAAYWYVRALPEHKPKFQDRRDRLPRWTKLSAFAVLSALALVTHYNAVFILVAWYLWWGAFAVTGSKGARVREVGIAIGTGLLMTAMVAPVVPIALCQIPGYANPNLTVPTVVEYLRQNWQAYIGGYAFPAVTPSAIGVTWLGAMLAIFVVGLMHYAYEERSDRDQVFAGLLRSNFSFMLFWFAGGLALYYLAVLDRGAFNVRYSSFVTPALYGLVAIAILAWRRWHLGLSALAAMVVLIGFAAGIRVDFYDQQHDREDITGVTAWLRENSGSNDVILVDQKYPFGFYYDRYAIDPGTTLEGAEAAPARYLFVDINTIDDRLTEWAGRAEQVYWVQWYESDTDPRRAVSFLLDKEGQRQGEENFRGYSIDWWRLDPPTEFELAPRLVPAEHDFGQAIQTLEISLPQDEITAGEEAPVVIRWQRVPGSQIDQPLKARVALYGAAGGRLAQADERILNDRHLLPAEWAPRDQPLNVYMLDVPKDVSPGEYALRLLVYDADSLEPLPLHDDAGNPMGLEADLGTILIAEDQ